MASDMFLEIQDIPGESTDDKHKNWIEILSFSGGVTQAVAGAASTGGARSAQRCDHSDFSFMKTLDKATPKLALACSVGTHIPKVVLELCRATGDKQLYYKLTMTDVLVTSAQVSGSSGGDIPMESVSMNYAKIEWEYTETDHKTGKKGGTTKTHWDLATNKGG